MSIASRIDHTILKAEATLAEVDKTVDEAKTYGFASVCVNGAFVAHVARRLAGTGVKTCAVAGFPLGAMKPTVKAIEATSTIKDGAAEVDFVAFLPNLLNRDLGAAKAEFLEIVRGVRMANRNAVVKVIIESALLLKGVGADEAEARIETACRAARETGIDFVKTSTGFHGAGGASVEAVSLMKKHSGGLYVKASGGIRTLDDANKMIAAGADRLGCSSGVAIAQAQAGNSTDSSNSSSSNPSSNKGSY